MGFQSLRAGRVPTVAVLLPLVLAACGSGGSGSSAEPTLNARQESCQLLTNNFQAADQVYSNALLVPLATRVQVLKVAKNGLPTWRWTTVSKKEAESRRKQAAFEKGRTFFAESFASLWPKVTDPDLKLVAHEIALGENLDVNFEALDSICPGYMTK